MMELPVKAFNIKFAYQVELVKTRRLSPKADESPEAKLEG